MKNTQHTREHQQPSAYAPLHETLPDEALANISAGDSEASKKLLTPIAQALDDFFKLFEPK